MAGRRFKKFAKQNHQQFSFISAFQVVNPFKKMPTSQFPAILL
jgi:hypothetical protein